MIDVVGRLPVNTRAETMASGVPSARTSSLVLPNARALVCAKKFDRNEVLVNDLKEPAWIVCCAGDIIVYRVRNIAA